MLDNLKPYHILLASNSPRRRELLAGLDLVFDVHTLPGIDESYPPALRGGEIPLYIARRKAAAYLPSLQADDLLITADTVVCVDDEVLGKPHDEAAAVEMLRLLSGRTHQVFTGVSISTCKRQESFVDESRVTFAGLSEEEIAYYVRQYRPFDKAGAYGIQEWIGYAAISGIEGSYFNVMGLPVQHLYRVLKQF